MLVRNPQTDVPTWANYSEKQRWGFLAILFLVSTTNYVDRHVFAVLLEPIKNEFHVSDTALGLLTGFAFATFNAVLGIPIARWADRGNRRTIVSLAVSLWSIMTMLCGLAQHFWQLALARTGVGASEAGAIPPAQSLIVDYFPPEQRALAVTAFSAAGTTGNLLAITVGGLLASAYGWRATLLIVGLPGLALALLSRFMLPEPRIERGFAAGSNAFERPGEAVRCLLRKRSYAWALVGNILTFMMQYGGLVFVPSYLVRVLHLPLAEVSASYGLTIAAAAITGALTGTCLAARLGRRDPRWLAWLPASACAVAAIAYFAAFTVDSLPVFLGLSFIGYGALVGGLPPGYAAIHAICGTRRRATAIAVVLFTATLIGGGVGPLITGALSDALQVSHGFQGLRYALLMLMTVLVGGALAFYLCGRAMPRDFED